jgi:tetratricopeptide (TPR) repeat protein
MATIEDRIAQGEEYKRKGNELFKAGKYKSAISKYGTVLAFIRGLPGSKRGLDGVAAMVNTTGAAAVVSQQQELDTTELEKVTLQNIATCHMKLQNNQEALQFCSKALKLDPKAWKVSTGAHLTRWLRKSETT